MNEFFSNFFVALTFGFYLFCAACVLGTPICIIIALFQKLPAKRRHYFLLSAKFFLLSLLFFVVGFGSCVMVLELDP